MLARWLYYVCPVWLYVKIATRFCERFDLPLMEGCHTVVPHENIWIPIRIIQSPRCQNPLCPTEASDLEACERLSCRRKKNWNGAADD